MKIRLENIWHSYDGQKYVLKNINLSFTEPGIYLVLGPNGVGKTTLLKIISLIIKPSIGRILIDGKDYWSLKEEERSSIRSLITYVHDKPILVRGSVRYNIELGLRLRKRVDNNVLEHYINRYGLKQLEKKPANKLSAGESKAVTIVRAFVIKPKMLVLDEPFTYLDSHRTKLLIEDIVNLARNEKTLVLIATHYMYKELVNIASKVIEIENGEIGPQTLR